MQLQGFVWSVTILLYMDLFGPKVCDLLHGFNHTIFKEHITSFCIQISQQQSHRIHGYD